MIGGPKDTSLCIDCIREGATEPKLRNKSSSYCNPHLHKRSVRSKDRNTIRMILEHLDTAIRNVDMYYRPPLRAVELDAAITALRATNRMSVHKLPLDLLEEFAAAQEREANEIMMALISRTTEESLPHDQTLVYRKQIRDHLWCAHVLRTRNQPTLLELAHMIERADPKAKDPHPVIDATLERIQTEDVLSSPEDLSSELDPEEYQPSWTMHK